MARQAINYAFKDGIGLDLDTYIDCDEKIEKFLNWYSDFCQMKNEILFLSGPKGSGKSTLLHHCSNFISSKPNYDLLERKGLLSQKGTFFQLDRAHFSWISSLDIEGKNGTLIDVLCEKVKTPSIFRRINPYLTPSFSYGPGSPEFSVKLGVEIPSGYETLEGLVDYLKKKRTENYVVWFKSLPLTKCETINALFTDIKTMGAFNLGIIVSVDQEYEKEYTSFSKQTIHFMPITEEELSLVIYSVCCKNKIRYDIGLPKLMLERGYDSFGKAIKLLQEVEMENRLYISKENVIKKMGEHG